MNRFLLLVLTAGLLSPVNGDEMFDTKQQAWDACVAWWKQGGDFYVSEGEGYNLVKRKLLLRHCFVFEPDKLILGQELTNLKSGETYTDKQLPAIGVGIAVPETIKIFKYKE